jgi:intracellular septation protein
MKILFDFFPVLAFFIAYYLPADRGQAIYIATAVAIVAAIIQVAGYWLMTRRFEKMHLITLALIVILGTATLLLHDKRFFMWKPTAVNWLFALVFLGSEFFGKKNMLQRMMDHAITVPKNIWLILNRSWTVFFILMGALNLFVAFTFAENIWVNFKLFGMLGLTLLFAIGQSIYMSRYITETDDGKE